jgi:FkbM family methyltransferase
MKATYEKLKIRKISSRLPAEFRAHIASLPKGATVIDLGANNGDITAVLAQAGCRVFAFEPNIVAFRKLSKRFAHNKNVHVFNVAVSHRTALVKLHLHENTEKSNADLTQASSLHVDKNNVSAENFDLVISTDIKSIMGSISDTISLMKIDIEGHEVEVINCLIDSELIDRIEKLFVETHENKVPSLIVPTQNLKEKVRSNHLEKKFFWQWH